MLEQLFESTRREKPNLPVQSRYSKNLNPTYIDELSFKKKSSAILLYNRLRKSSSANEMLEMLRQKLDNMRKELHNMRSAWINSAQCEEGQTLLPKRSVSHMALFKILNFRVKSQDSISPVEVFKKYISWGLLEDKHWHMAIWYLLGTILKGRKDKTREASSELLGDRLGDRPGDRLKDQLGDQMYLLNDVLQLWKLFFETFGTSPDTSEATKTDLISIRPTESYPKSATAAITSSTLGASHPSMPTSWTGLLRPGESNLSRLELRPSFATRFLQCLPRRTESYNTPNLAAAAVATYICFGSANTGFVIPEPTMADARPFLQLIQQIALSSRAIDINFTSRFFKCLSRQDIVPPLAQQIYDEWRNLVQVEYADTGGPRVVPAKAAPVYKARSIDPAVQPDLNTENLKHKEKNLAVSMNLHKALYAPDAKAAQRLWTRQLQVISNGGNIDPSLYADFLRTFFGLGCADRATEVWNLMKYNGCEPTILHWSALLEGCGRLRDLSSLRSIWKRIRASNVQPDNHAWRAYIEALLLCRDVPTAMQALEEMGKDWDSSRMAPTTTSPQAISSFDVPSSIDHPNATRPSIIHINTAIRGLIANRRVDLGQEVLNWALQHAITPDTTTFNILLRPAVRLDQPQEVRRLLAEMKHYACEPDVVTFTILIDGMFRNPSSQFQSASPEDQEDLISRVFADMAENGINANTRTYSTILDGLLAPKYFNLPAARAVLARMARQGLSPSIHIYTILITHYFSLSPPDLQAIASIWQRISLNQLPVDHVFYDRMIEGYSRIGAIDKMLAFLRRMPAQAMKPGWRALLGVLKALVNAEEWDLIRDLVWDVGRENDGLLSAGSRGWKGKDEFWDFIGLLRAKGMDLPDLAEYEAGMAVDGESSRENEGEIVIDG